MASLSNTEPVALAGTAAAVVGVVTAGVGLAVSFGAHISDVQQGAIVAFVIAVIVLSQFISSRWARNRVTPVATANKAIDAAFKADAATDVKPTLANPAPATPAPPA